ncbi:Kunitz/Bovine pancreatic trypsin inhibitor domain containing protein [Brugia malayi]|uniref:BMA-BLI-5 n=1 Tax=Brugia malayi TaxID=6279 RepID=A0A1P6C050_BRUMA|nr:Kunitz/Bovine pancreatic trypsin inhibitor domain containing protein [Brugia malayi]ACZ64267.1 serine protease inhibitor [Brugia malayi]CRZ25429.1 BMA-BLI-5 [Brugia malayi]VIO90788.1 Kunitz/Bovine pancreatic trypsin inhibitor domain containing protein [Brugia malayi]
MRIYVILALAKIAIAKECKNDECENRWPGAICRNGRCACPQDSIRRKSDSNGWICLSLIDASTGMLGPPFTCPLPSGTGYRSILYRNNEPVFCQTLEENNCPEGYECIQSIGLSTAAGNGVCCPRKETACLQPVCQSKDGWLIRWYFNGETCESFRWNPEVETSANNFVTKQHCLSYCAFVNSESINQSI